MKGRSFLWLSVAIFCTIAFLPAVYCQSTSDVVPLTVPGNLRDRALPVDVDNSAAPWFPPVYSQQWFPNCQQASGVYHAYTYAINRARHDTANCNDHLMSANFTYNFYDGESQNGVSFLNSYQIIKEAGNPTVTDFGEDHQRSGLYWMSGYDKYLRAMSNRIDKVYSIPLNTVEGHNTMRQWLFDHIDGSEWGGVAVFSGHAPYSNYYLPPESPHAGFFVMTRFITTPAHGMTIVGYNDSIRFDVNNDGLFTNNIDINGDGRIDMGDWEIGGYLVVNSYGTEWGTGGKFYLLYSAFAQGLENYGAINECAYAVDVKENYIPKLTAKILLNHNLRNRMSLKIGLATDTSRAYPEVIKEYQIFNYLGQAHCLSGNDTLVNGEQFEAGLDLTPLLEYVQADRPFKVFLIVDQRYLSDGQIRGVVHSFSVFAGDTEFVSPVTETVTDGVERTLIPVVVTVKQPEKPSITTTELPPYEAGGPYSVQLEAGGGTPPYRFAFNTDYQYFEKETSYPVGNPVPVAIQYTRTRLAYVDLPFEFPFYGKKFSTIYIGDNGTINFDSISYPYIYIRDAKAYLKDRFCIVGGYSLSGYDYRPEGDVIMVEKRDDHVLVEWHVVSHLTGDTITPAVMLYPSGRIEIYRPPFSGTYPEMVYTGISEGDQCSYRLETYNQTDVHTNHCITFVPVQPAAGFSLTESGQLTFQPVTDTVAYSASVKVTDMENIRAVKTFPLYNILSATAVAEQAGTSDSVFNLQITVSNHSGVSYENLSLSVATSNPAITMTTPSGVISQLGAMQSASVNDVISFSADNLLGNFETVSFVVTIKGTGIDRTLYLPVVIQRPEVDLIGVQVDDGHNNRLDPGETADLLINVANVSDVALNDLRWKLTSDDTTLTVLDSAFSEPVQLKEGQFGSHYFTLHASRTATDGSVLPVVLTLKDTIGFERNFTISVTVGKAMALIADAAKKSYTADTLEKYFQLMGISSRRVKSAVVDFNAPAIFLLLGSQSSSYNMTTDESGRFGDYLIQGGNLYLEGFNFWHYGLKTRLNKCLKYTTTAASVNRYDSLSGYQGNFLEGMRVKMTLGNSISTYIMNMLGNSTPLFQSEIATPHPIVYSKDTSFRVIGSIAEAGNMSPVYPLSMRRLIGSYCDFLGIDTSGIRALFHALNRNITAGDTVHFSDDSFDNISSRQWEFPGGEPAVSTAPEPDIVYSEPGVYQATLTVWKNGLSRSITRESYVNVSPATGIGSRPDVSSPLWVSPNPARDHISLYSPFTTGVVKIEWFSMQGSILWSGEVSGSSRITLPVSFLPSGACLLRVSQNGKVFSTVVTKVD